MSFTIATLTCNNRNSLFTTIQNIINSTDVEGLTWTIFAQGCTYEFHNSIRKYFKNTNITLRLFTNKDNLGCSKGFNKLWTHIEEFDYVLLIEDDWYLLPQEDKLWLKTSIELMNEQSQIDIIYYRKYQTDQECWQYGWTRHIHYMCFQGRLRFNYAESMKGTIPFEYKKHMFQQIPEFMYTNNPTLYRVSSYKQRNIYPLLELEDKHNLQGAWTDSSFVQTWGVAEALVMEKTHDCYTLYMDNGCFVHNC